jgi:hypothetical protein
MIAALSRASQVFGDPAYADAARLTAEFLLTHLRGEDGRLLHRFCEGETAVAALAEDYAFLTWGLIELFEASFDVRVLEEARALERQMDAHFWDHAGGYFQAPDDGEALLARLKEWYDGAIPSANAIAMQNLLKLAHLTDAPELAAKAQAIARAAVEHVRKAPSGYCQLLASVDMAIGPFTEVVVAGRRDDPETERLLVAVRRPFAPNSVLLFRPMEEEAPAIAVLAPFLRELRGRGEQATAFICRDRVCEAPTTDPDEAAALVARHSIG